MTIIEEIYSEISTRIECDDADAKDAAQAVWEVVQARLLSEEVVEIAMIKTAIKKASE